MAQSLFQTCPRKNGIWKLEKSGFTFNERTVSIVRFSRRARSRCHRGGAGTGKTILAVEHARRLAINNEKVLFLVYNSLLKKISQKNTLNTIQTFKCIVSLDFQKFTNTA